VALQGVTMILVSIMVMLMTSTVPADSATLLPPCPSSPNCVSSMATDSHHIEPLAISGDAGTCFARLKTVLGNRKDTTIIEADESQIRVEFRTFLGFVDDGLFVLDIPNGRIQVRSAARTGYWDFGKNRRRMEEIRGEYSR
jgi:uncharacterized protein (DUF1499 family)